VKSSFQLDEQFLQFSVLGLSHWPISLCVDLFVFICVYFVCFCLIPHSCCIIVTQWGGPDGIEA